MGETRSPFASFPQGTLRNPPNPFIPASGGQGRGGFLLRRRGAGKEKTAHRQETFRQALGRNPGSNQIKDSTSFRPPLSFPPGFSPPRQAVLPPLGSLVGFASLHPLYIAHRCASRGEDGAWERETDARQVPASSMPKWAFRFPASQLPGFPASKPFGPRPKKQSREPASSSCRSRLFNKSSKA